MAPNDIVLGKMKAVFACMILCAVLVGPSNAEAAVDVVGNGETDYAFSNRRGCCEAASAAARDNGIAKCRARGGISTLDRGVRGSCDTSTGRDGHGRPIYACTSQVEIRCR